MIGRPAHNRRFGIGGASLTLARIPNETVNALVEVSKEVEGLLLRSGYLDEAPFWWVNLMIQFGLKDDDEPSISRIHRKYGDLPLTIEIDTHRILATENWIGRKRVYDLEKLKHIFKTTALKSLIHAGKRYDRPVEALVAELARIAGEPSK